MKKFKSILTGALLTLCMFLPQYAISQSPQKMSYQSVIRNATDDLVTESTVGIQISIIQGTPAGTAAYVETHAPMTNINGLASLEIGMGTAVTGTFTSIDWSAGPYFIKTDTDPLGGTAYSLTGTTELLSVPYALYAANSGSWTVTADAVHTDMKVGIGTETPNAQLHVINEGSNEAVFGQSTFLGFSDLIGVRGYSVNAPGYGYGGRFMGGYMGVRGTATSSTYAGTTNGLYGEATGTAGHRRGVYGNAYNPGGLSAYGLYGSGSGATTNYGVYGTASGGETNWAGYFDGKVRVSSSTGSSSETSNAQLHVFDDVGENISVISGENTFLGTFDKRAINGLSINAPGYGYGGRFEGGYMGVRGTATSSTYAGATYGLYGSAGGSAGTRIGVWGTAFGGETNWAGYFVGDVRITGTLDNTSDARLKKDIEDLENALDIIKQLEPKTYEFRTDEFPQMGLDNRPQLGFIAQDMEQVLPQLVRTAIHPGIENDEREKSGNPNSPDVDIKSINYIGIIPVLTQGIKELASEVEVRDEAIEVLKVQMARLEAKLGNVDAMTIRMERIEKELESLRK